MGNKYLKFVPSVIKHKHNLSKNSQVGARFTAPRAHTYALFDRNILKNERGRDKRALRPVKYRVYVTNMLFLMFMIS